MLQWIKRHIITTNKKTAAMRVKFIAAFFCLLLTIFLNAPYTRAQSIADPNSELNQGVKIIQEPLGLTGADIRIVIARIIRAALGVIGIILVILVLYGGVLWMTAGGNEEQIGQAKKIMINAAIGLAIILTAFSIVSYILKMLGFSGGYYGGSEITPPGVQNFQGSGALGSVIRDHYPIRNQKEVPRNTKIIVTFRKPLLLTPDWAQDKNGDGILGNCKTADAQFTWKEYCDQLKLSKDYITITRSDTGEQITGANILAAFENGKVYTIVIRPFDPLGSGAAKVPYLVHLGSKMQLDDPANNNPLAFSSQTLGNNYYEWQFTCSTELDLTPPVVVSVYPDAKSIAFKNSVIQIDFSEPMDPIGIQGTFFPTKDNNNSFAINGNTIFLQNLKSTAPSGTFRLVNGYQTLEFTPTLECGVNACGGKIFCLPVCDAPGAHCPADPSKQDNYELLVKTGQATKNSFEALPFSGAVDLAGNALDGNKNGTVEIATTTLPVFPNWKMPDNYSWSFIVSDQLDITSPRLQTITPGLDAQYIESNHLWQMVFSKRMRVEPFYDVMIDEKPSPAQRGDNVPICKMPRVRFNFDGTTRARMEHCPFLDGQRQYYFPTVTADVQDTNFNCFYPASGPGDAGNKGGKAGGTSYWSNQGGDHLDESLACDADGNNCCAVTSSPETAALCCNGLAKLGAATTTASCLSEIKNDSL